MIRALYLALMACAAWGASGSHYEHFHEMQWALRVTPDLWPGLSWEQRHPDASRNLHWRFDDA